MKKTTLASAIALTLILSTAAAAADTRHTAAATAAGSTAGTTTTPDISCGMMEKDFDIRNFTAIKVEDVATIRFTQGSTYTVRAKGTKTLVDRLRVSEEGACLTIALDGHRDTGWISRKREITGKVTLEITAPDISRLTVNGSAEIETFKLNTGSLKIDNSGVVRAFLGDTHVRTLHINNSGSASIDGDLTPSAAKGAGSGESSITICNSGVVKLQSALRADGVSIDNSGSINGSYTINSSRLAIGNSGVMKVDIDNRSGRAAAAAGEVSISNSGSIQGNCRTNSSSLAIVNSGVMKVDVDNHSGGGSQRGAAASTGKVSIDNTGSINGSYSLSGKLLAVDNNGVLKINARFKGDDVKVSNSGGGKVTLDVDCKTLDIFSENPMQIEVSGKGESTSITGKSAIRVDTSRYNKF